MAEQKVPPKVKKWARRKRLQSFARASRQLEEARKDAKKPPPKDDS